MQVALIYPPALLKKHGERTRYHLVLPHLYQEKRYRDFYRKRSSNGDYIILDNGAAEDLEFGHKHLHTVAEGIGAHEIVVPDTLGDANDTIAKGLAFSRYTRTGYRYMMVAQGSTVMECVQTIDMIATDTKFMYVTAIGIPRLINHEDRHARFKVANFIEKYDYHRVIEIHYLGADKHLDEVGYLAGTGVGRGIDTSAPIYMAMEGLVLANMDPWFPRPNDYFQKSRNSPMIERNVETYLEWANYDRDEELPEKSEHWNQA